LEETTMNQKEAYDRGRSNGYSAATYLDADAIRWASDELDYGDPEFLEEPELEEVAGYAAHLGEGNARDYAGFSYFAMEINRSGDRAEGLWEKYDKGVAVGIDKGVREWMKEQRRR
jgi:hypothetical protein